MWLTPERRENALHLSSFSEQLSYIASGILLHKFLGITNETQLKKNAYGKPFLVNGLPYFNLSRSVDCAILAVADYPIGVDIEPKHNPPAYEYTARKVFTYDELRWLDLNKTPERFLILWTRKEAVLKLDGRGFYRNPQLIPCLNSDSHYIQHHCCDKHIIACAMHIPFTISFDYVML